MVKSSYPKLKKMVEDIKNQVHQEFIPLMLVEKEIAKRFGMDTRTQKKYLDFIKKFGMLRPHPEYLGFVNPNYEGKKEKTPKKKSDNTGSEDLDKYDKLARGDK